LQRPTSVRLLRRDDGTWEEVGGDGFGGNMDPTEAIRRAGVAEINGAIESDNEGSERCRLEIEYGKVWDTEELGRDFEVIGFCSPCVEVRRKQDGQRGTLFFQHHPRFYFGFEVC